MPLDKLPAVLLQASNVYEEISDAARRNEGSVFWFLIIVASIVTVITIYLLIKSRYTRIQARAENIIRFNEVMESREFEEEEKKLLTGMALRYAADNPYSLVDKLSFFDECVEKEINRLKNSNLSKEKQDELSMRISRIRRKLGFRTPMIGQQMSSTRELEIGHMMHLYAGGTNKRVYIVRVVDVDEMDIIITRPPLKDGYLLLPPGTAVTCYIWREYDAGYYFKTKVLGQVDKPMPMAFLEHSTSLSRMQRRHYYRVPVKLNVKFYHISWEQLREIKEKQEYIELEKLPPYDATVEDISGGGIAFHTVKRVVEGELFTVVLDLDDGEEPLQAAGKVLKVSQEKDGSFVVRAEFAGISEKKRSRIIRYVYKEQVNESRIAQGDY